MEAWVQQDFQPVGQDYDGNDLYGYICVIPQDDAEAADLRDFLINHGIEMEEE